MNSESSEYTIVNENGKEIKVKCRQEVFKDPKTKEIIVKGLVFEHPTRFRCSDDWSKYKCCNTCIYRESYKEDEDGKPPFGVKHESTDYTTYILLDSAEYIIVNENGEQTKVRTNIRTNIKFFKEVKMFYWCRKSDIKLDELNAPCEFWDDNDKKINEDGTANLINYHQTDYGNAERLVAVYGDVIRYCYDYEKWYYWDEKRWKQDTGERLMTYAKSTVRDMFRQADNLDDKERRQFIAYALECENAARINAMIKLSEDEKTISRDVLDQDRFKFNSNNKTLDLKAFNHYNHNRYDYISKITKAPLDMNADYTEWVDFLNIAFKNDQDIISAIKRCVGYCLTGDIGENVFFILHGVGNNGKSTFLNTLLYIFGEYGTSIQSDTIMVRKNPDEKRTDLARLVGIRFIACSEGMEGGRLNEATVKQITGGDEIICRFLYGNEFAYIPEYKIWYATNHKPDIRTTDDGTWRRIVYIPFDVNIPAALKEMNKPRITNYDQVLVKHAAGILRWAIEGLQDYYKHGGLDIPQKMLDKVKEYRAEMDIVQSWLDEEAETNDPNAFQLNADINNIFNNWAVRNGEHPLTPKILSARLKEKGFDSFKGTGGARGKKGIRIKDEVYSKYLRNKNSGDQSQISGDRVAFKEDRHSENLTPLLADNTTCKDTISGVSGDISLEKAIRADKKKKSETPPQPPHRHSTLELELVQDIKENVIKMNETLYNGQGVPESSLIKVLLNLEYTENNLLLEIKRLLEIGELQYVNFDKKILDVT